MNHPRSGILGVLGFGQGDVPQLVQDATLLLRSGVRLVQDSALNGLTKSELDGSLAVSSDVDITVAQLATGEEVQLSTGRLVPFLQRAVKRLEGAGSTYILPGCAGPVPPGLVFPAPHLDVAAELMAAVDHYVVRGRVRIVLPSSKHALPTTRRYTRAGRKVACALASPQEPDRLVEVALVGEVDLIVLACFDYTMTLSERVRREAECPVISSREVALQAVARLLAPDRALEARARTR